MPIDWSATGGDGWYSVGEPPSSSYRCGYCGFDVASARGWITQTRVAVIRICPQCNVPTFFSAQDEQIPGPLPGGNVVGIGDHVASLYNEARRSFSVGAYTGAVMLCRKVLMNVSVQKGADEDLRFVEYVEWLLDEHYAPTGSKVWVDYIKDRGNEANHEIRPMTQSDAEGVLRFTEQLLRNMFELPSLVPAAE